MIQPVPAKVALKEPLLIVPRDFNQSAFPEAFCNVRRKPSGVGCVTLRVRFGVEMTVENSGVPSAVFTVTSFYWLSTVSSPGGVSAGAALRGRAADATRIGTRKKIGFTAVFLWWAGEAI